MMRVAAIFALTMAVTADAKIWASEKEDPALQCPPNDPGTGVCKWHEAIKKYGSTAMWNAKIFPNKKGKPGYIPGGDKELMTFTGWWGLHTRPRRPILIIEDMNEGYKPYLDYLVPKIKIMIDAFRKAGLPILWTTWARRWDDGAWGSNDRFYGPMNNAQQGNPEYVYRKNGIDIIAEVAPNDDEGRCEKRMVLESMHLSKFNDRYADGKHILGPMLEQMGVDTVVMTGGWTEDCILGTIADAVDAWGLDAIAVADGVGTATREQNKAESIYKTSYCAVRTAQQMAEFMASEDGKRLFLPPVKSPCDVKIEPTTEPDFQKHYKSAVKYFKDVPVVKGIKKPITLEAGEGGPSKPLTVADLQQQVKDLKAENTRVHALLKKYTEAHRDVVVPEA